MPERGKTGRWLRSELSVPLQQETGHIPVRQQTTTARGWRTPWYVIQTASLPLLLHTEPLFIEGASPSFDIVPVREVTAAKRVTSGPAETTPVRSTTSVDVRR